MIKDTKVFSRIKANRPKKINKNDYLYRMNVTYTYVEPEGGHVPEKEIKHPLGSAMRQACAEMSGFEVADGEVKLVGYIAGDTFGKRGGSHFASLEGNVVCGTKNRFGMDCASEIRIKNFDNFETDQWKGFSEKDVFDLRKNHLPMSHFITCKKCQAKIKKLLDEKTNR